MGRTLIFTSDAENPHYVERLLSGERYVLAFWFTCDARKEFEIFLDGEAHSTFSNSIKERITKQRTESESGGQRQDEDSHHERASRKKRHRKKVVASTSEL